MFDALGPILTIVVIDLALSGDNAVVIGMAARRLSPQNRRRAILWGGAGAIALRIIFTAMAALLLGIPYLQAIGGVLLLWIAYRLLRPEDHSAHVGEAASLGEAIRTIVLADVVMSFDNILAVGGAAHGDVRLLLFGLVLSIPIILFGSELVARMIGRFPIVLYVGVLVLVHTAVSMILEDDVIHDRLEVSTLGIWIVAAVASAAVIGVAWWLRRSRHVEPAVLADDGPTTGAEGGSADGRRRPETV